MPYPPQKKLKKKKKKKITPAKTNAPISQTSSERKLQTSSSNVAWTTSRENIKSIFAS